MTARILVGTCSWTDRTLIEGGDFYPPEAKTPADRLRFYAESFPIVMPGYPDTSEEDLRKLARFILES